jgi:aquaporin Z
MNSGSIINWKSYFIEAWSLGMFMISATLFVVLFEHPAFHINTIISNGSVRRMCIGIAMGITAILLIYSKWGKHSGAHMNPAVTLANYFLNRISLTDTIGYMLAQIFGATIAMLILNFFFHHYLSAPSVNYIVTMPGKDGIGVALLAEFILSFIIFITVLIVSNSKLAAYTGYIAGLLVFIFISIEAPLSGMSINPARSFGPAFVSGNWNVFWIYIVAPILGMQLAAFVFRSWYFNKKGECKSFHCFMSGNKHTNSTYHVFQWRQKNENGKVVKMYNTQSLNK